MPDITMCHGTDNPLCKTCYRKLAKPNPFRQAWFDTPLIKDGKCEYYSNINE